GIASIESDVPADLAPDRPPALFRDAPGDGARRHAARLQQQDGPGTDERRRHARRLSGAWRGGHDNGAAFIDTRDDISQARVNREWFEVGNAAHEPVHLNLSTGSAYTPPTPVLTWNRPLPGGLCLCPVPSPPPFAPPYSRSRWHPPPPLRHHRPPRRPRRPPPP